MERRKRIVLLIVVMVTVAASPSFSVAGGSPVRYNESFVMGDTGCQMNLVLDGDSVVVASLSPAYQNGPVGGCVDMGGDYGIVCSDPPNTPPPASVPPQAPPPAWCTGWPDWGHIADTLVCKGCVPSTTFPGTFDCPGGCEQRISVERNIRDARANLRFPGHDG
jgi:hypothetical protein